MNRPAIISKRWADQLAAFYVMSDFSFEKVKADLTKKGHLEGSCAFKMVVEARRQMQHVKHQFEVEESTLKETTK